jgi:uncharacterized protein DUF4249
MKKIFYVLLILITAGCTQKYIPPVKPSGNNYLVVEGTLNSGAGPATITLSHTTNLDTLATQYEQGAQIIVQADDSSEFALHESNNGQYIASDLNLNTSKKYRLKIQRSNGELYVSDFVNIVPNPPIDSINYTGSNAGLQIFVNTHNPQNNTRYYQWVYDETWEFHSAYYSSLKYIIQPTPQGYLYYLSPAVQAYYPPDPVDSTIYKCWQSDASTQLLLGSSATLSSDIINLPVAVVPAGSQKLSVLYSIDVKQYGWSQQGYQFLQTMQKNTEGTGSVFNPLPSQLISNIHCINNPVEPVIGYFNISQAQEKRIFISAADVPDWDYERSCPDVILLNNPDSIAAYGSSYLPVSPAKTKPIPFSLNLEIITFNAALPACVDCTLNGTNVKPDFWP